MLLQKASELGLDPVRAQTVLAGDAFAAEVRQAESFDTSHSIHAVPAIILNDRHLISGGQPPEVFEQALQQLAANPVA